MSIIVTGADGYIGWPTALRIAGRTDERVIGVDNFGRREWVESIGSKSAAPIASMEKRLDSAREHYDVANLSFVEGELTDRSFVDQLLSVHEPRAIVHTAAQPSAPYSQINGDRANFTQHNNMQATRNLVWGLEENGSPDTHFIETTTTGIYGAPEFPIPEGGAVMENQGERDEVPFPAMAGSWYHNCYDRETEILTRDGWKRFPAVTETDEVMSMDFETGKTSWTIPTELQEYDYSGEMVTVSNRRVDLKVTPNHRMLIGTSWAQGGSKTFESRRKIVQAEQLGTEYKHPCFFTSFPDWTGTDRSSFTLPECEKQLNQHEAHVVLLKEKEIEMDAWLRFFGWWLAEGSVGKDDQTNNIRLYQTGADDLTYLLTDIGVESESIRHHIDEKQEYIETTDQQLASYLRTFANDRHIPDWIRNLPTHRLEPLLSALVEGDGTENGRGWTYYTSSPSLADHVQEIAVKIGYGAKVHSLDRTEGSGYQQKVEYRVGISPTWCIQTNQGKDAFGRKQYDGKVYCCTVDGGLVYVRRNGQPVWCGNSKAHDAANLRLAHKQFDIPISDVRTAITYGTETEETSVDPSLRTRFDFDYYFGVVAHRFCAQAVAGYPLTVYGKGEQRKPFVSLEDAVEGLARLAIDGPEERPADHVNYNQVTRPISIVEIAETISSVASEFDLDVEVAHVENPRDEDETHRMEMENDRYMDLIGEQRQSFEDGVRDILETLTEHADTITAHEDRFLPDMLEE